MSKHVLQLPTDPTMSGHRVVADYLERVSSRLELLLVPLIPDPKPDADPEELTDVYDAETVNLMHRFALLQEELMTFRTAVLSHALQAGALAWVAPPSTPA